MRRRGRRIPRTELRRQSGRRLGVFVIVVFVIFSAIAVRLFDLQAVSRDSYASRGDAQRTGRYEIDPVRGDVLDRHGHSLAISVDAPSLYAAPNEIADPVAASLELAPVLGLDEADLREKLSTDKGFVWLARKLDETTAQRVRDLEIPGLNFVSESDRRYPSGSLAASVLGFTDIDNKGLAGVERQYDEDLRGEPGQVVLERDPEGRAIPAGQRHIEPGRPGTSVQLTLDSAIQYEAESVLKDSVARYGATGGVAAVMDPRNGDLLAFATYPTFDPNDPGRSTGRARKPWGVGDVFEPGSTSKVVTIAGAIEEGAVTPATTFGVPDAIQVWDRTYKDDESHPALSMTVQDIIAQSSNVGTIKIAMELNASRLDAWMRRFGYGHRTGIELPAESKGIYADRKDWTGVSVSSFAIGHGIAVTPLQMLRVYAAIANGGVMHEPRLVVGTQGPDGFEAAPRPEPTAVVSPATAATVRDMLTRVVSDGTGGKAAVEGYNVGGKTGTARKPKADGSGYENKHVASFIGMLPAEDPRVVVMVALDEPDQIYGGLTAAPTFSRLAAFCMRVLRVPPSPEPQAVNGPPHHRGRSGSPERYRPPTPVQIDKREAETAPVSDPAPESQGGDVALGREPPDPPPEPQTEGG